MGAGYRAWITAQKSELEAEVGLEPKRRENAEFLLRRAGIAADRIAAGIELLALEDVREAFCM